MLFNPLSLVAGRGPLVALLGALALGVALIGVGTERYFAGKSAGIEQDRARSDAVIAGITARAQEALDEANARTDAKSKELTETKERMQREYDTLKTENGRRLAAIVAERDGLRDQLADYASGSVEASRDSVEACRQRADALGRVLERVVQGYAVCTGRAEDNAEGVRTLRAWADRVEVSVREAGAN